MARELPRSGDGCGGDVCATWWRRRHAVGVLAGGRTVGLQRENKGQIKGLKRVSLLGGDCRLFLLDFVNM